MGIKGERMDTENLLTLIAPYHSTVELRAAADRPAIAVPVDDLYAVMQTLHDLTEQKFDLFVAHTAIDRIEENRFELVYILSSTVHGHTIYVTANISRENPVAPSMVSLWPTAEWQEREAYDLIGILYDNHPDLRRVFLEDDWIGFPLRKDYRDPYMLDLPK